MYVVPPRLLAINTLDLPAAPIMAAFSQPIDPCSSLNETLQNSIISNDIHEIAPKYQQDKLISDWVNQPMYCPMETVDPEIPKTTAPPKKKKRPKKKKTAMKPALVGYDTTIPMRNIVNTPQVGAVTAEVFNAEKN